MSPVVAALVLGIVVPVVTAGIVAYGAWTPVRLRRRWAAAEARAEPPADLTERPYDVAYLHGGPQLAVHAALVALHRRAALSGVGRRTVVAVGTDPAGTDELERAVHEAAATTITARRLARSPVVAAALGRIDDRLVAERLLLSVERRRRIRASGIPTAAGAALIVLVILGEVVPGTSWYGLFYFGVAILFLADPPRSNPARYPRADSGNDALRQLAQEHPEPSPEEPDPAPDGPDELALAIGIHGVPALRAADPDLAARGAVGRIAPLVWPPWWTGRS